MPALTQALAVVRPWLGAERPVAAIVLGSGLGGLTGVLTESRRLGYDAVPGFALPDVPGHAGELVVGRLVGRPVLCQAGRFHAYEGHAASAVGLPIRLFSALGIDTLIVTNAAGGIRRTFRPGTLMLLADHVNLTFRNPLIGPVVPGEERFPDMSAPYDAALRAQAHLVARRLGHELVDGVYAGVLGPSYETPAEIRMLERLGADAVGMSTVQEVVVARARGMRCLGLSVITNLASGISATRLSHEEVMAEGRAAGGRVQGIVAGLVAGLSA
jgi:purine-nucleoside phosphorylase